MIYIDRPRRYGHKRKKYFHIGGSRKRLDTFAQLLGLGPHWGQRSNSGLYHYDAPEEFFDRAVEAGAEVVTRTEFLKRLKNDISSS